MIDLKKFGGLRGKPLKLENIDGDVAVFTIAQYGEQANTGKGRKLSPVLRFRECPDYLFYMNLTQLERLVERLGADETRWIGKRVPLHGEETTYEDPETGHEQKGIKLYVMPTHLWDEVLKEAGAAEEATSEKVNTAPKAPEKVKAAGIATKKKSTRSRTS